MYTVRVYLKGGMFSIFYTRSRRYYYCTFVNESSVHIPIHFSKFLLFVFLTGLLSFSVGDDEGEEWNLFR